jgi:hypothetical protein
VKDHRPQLDIPGIGTWSIEPDTRAVEFLGEHNYAQNIQADLWKFFTGGSKPKFVDTEKRFVLLDAQDEILRGDGISGELKAVVKLDRIQDHALRRSEFVPASTPVFVYEHGIVVFSLDGWPLWSRNDLLLGQLFQRIEGNSILYFSEHRGGWGYDLATGSVANSSSRLES